MNEMLRDCILDINMLLLDNNPIKGCPKDQKDEAFEEDDAGISWLTILQTYWGDWKMCGLPSLDTNSSGGSTAYYRRGS